MIFPTQTAKIEVVKHMKPFDTNSGQTMYGISISMDNGDNFKHFSLNKSILDAFQVGEKLTYKLVKKEEGKTRISPDYIIGNPPKKALISTLDSKSMKDYLFIDIETVAAEKSLTKKSKFYEAWEYKKRKENLTDAKLRSSFKEEAALWPEFGKIVCISIGVVRGGQLMTRSYYGHDEFKLLSDFIKDTNEMFNRHPNVILCGHSLLIFDLPFIQSRMIVNGIRVPDNFNVMYKKPWDLDKTVFDQAVAWRGTGFRSTSLLSIANVLGIPSPKQSLQGSEVSKTYYEDDEGLRKIYEYCEKDVLTCVNIQNRLFNLDIISNFVSRTNEQD